MSYLILIVLFWPILFMAGCIRGAQPIACPYGTYPRRATSHQDGRSGVSGEASLPSQSGKAGASWGASGDAAWFCDRICPPGTASQLTEGPNGKRELKCNDLGDCPNTPFKVVK